MPPQKDYEANFPDVSSSFICWRMFDWWQPEADVDLSTIRKLNWHNIDKKNRIWVWLSIQIITKLPDSSLRYDEGARPKMTASQFFFGGNLTLVYWFDTKLLLWCVRTQAFHYLLSKLRCCGRSRWSGDVIRRTGIKNINAVSHNRARPYFRIQHGRGEVRTRRVYLNVHSVTGNVVDTEWSAGFWRWKCCREFGNNA